ncbi:polysaccharide biosynthesis protein [Marinilabiliaceae bacterium JC017]|nr:polysaccharide biosynthesis protein [Marinilabiliaceae bacterium JC017]
MGINKKFVKDSLVYGLGSGIKKLLGFLLLPFYTRALTVGEFGVLDSLSTMTMLVTSVLGLGLETAGGFYFFKAKNQRRDIIYTLFVIRIFMFIPALVLLVFHENLSFLLFQTSEYKLAVALALALIPVNLMMSEQTRLYRLYKHPWKFSFLILLKSITNILLGIGLVVVLRYGVNGSLSARLISSTIVVAVSFLTFSRKKYSFKFRWKWAIKMLKFGFPLIWSAIAVWVLNVSDRFFLLHYSTLDEIGKYSIGSTFSQPVLFINMAVQMSFGVLFMETFFRDKDQFKEESREAAVKMYDLYLGITSVVAVIISIFSFELVGFIATKDYMPGAVAVSFLTFAHIAAQSYQLMGPGIVIAEKTWHFTWITIVCALVNIGLNFIAIPLYGFLGAAITTLFSFLIYWGLKIWVSHRYMPIDYNYLKIFVFYFLMFFIGSLIPLCKYLNLVELRWWYYLVLSCAGITLPFLFRLISVKQVVKMVKLGKDRIIG